MGGLFVIVAIEVVVPEAGLVVDGVGLMALF